MDQEHYPLDETLIGLLADFAKAFTQTEQNAQLINAQRQGALVLFIRQHGLEGDWRVADNGRELVKAVKPAAQGTT